MTAIHKASKTATLETIVDTIRYPINQPDSPGYSELIKRCQNSLLDNGLCLLNDFLTESALAQVKANAVSLGSEAYRTEHWRATPNGAGTADVSVLASQTRAAMGSIGYDRLSSESPLRLLYRSHEFTAFLNAVFNREPLYPTADPLIGCMLTVLEEGDELGWHYDPNDLVVSLSVQQADSGGEFEFAPAIRAPAVNAWMHEAAVMEGRYEGLISRSLSAGTLSFFNGHRSLHRVAPVGQGQARIIALFNYSETPGYVFSDDIRQRFFGRCR